MDEELSARLQRIEEKIDNLIRLLENRSSREVDVNLLPMRVESAEGAPVNVFLMRLPDSLRRTMFAMRKLREATTLEVARETGRSRSVESIHLNQLERMGYLEKFRRGRRIYFRIPSPPSKNSEVPG